MARTGHIYTSELDISYLNVGFATIFKLNFALESGLGAQDFIKIKFPFNIGQSQQASLYSLSDSSIIKKHILSSYSNNEYFWNFNVTISS